MRIFLSIMVFDMIARSLLDVSPVDDWGQEFGLPENEMPLRLPTARDLRAIDRRVDSNYGSRAERYQATLESVGDFFYQAPPQAVREKLQSRLDYARYGLWRLYTRLRFVGKLVGVDQSWKMFSPNVGTRDRLARFRLRYDDGSQRIVRLGIDPPDATRHFYWMFEKHIQTEAAIHRDVDARTGYCNMLAHRHAVSERGARLSEIDVFAVEYVYPTPYEHARSALAPQSGPPENQFQPLDEDATSYQIWTYDARRYGPIVRGLAPATAGLPLMGWPGGAAAAAAWSRGSRQAAAVRLQPRDRGRWRWFYKSLWFRDA